MGAGALALLNILNISEFIHAQAIQDVGEFFPSVKKIFS